MDGGTRVVESDLLFCNQSFSCDAVVANGVAIGGSIKVDGEASVVGGIGRRLVGIDGIAFHHGVRLVG